MGDLISREEYGAILDEQLRFYDSELSPIHKTIIKLQRERLDDMPAVDAIPVDWLRERMLNGEPKESKAAWRVLKEWNARKEAKK